MSNAAAWVPYVVATVLFYGLAQALTKQYMANLTASAFILLYVLTKAVVNVAAFGTLGTKPLLDETATTFIQLSIVGNVINGFAWLFFYKALESGKVSLVGSVTAGYPALTVLLALVFLGEQLAWFQGVGVALVIGSGMLVAFGPKPADELAAEANPSRKWLLWSGLTFLGWGVYSAFIKACFNAPGADTYTFFIWNALGALVVLLPYAVWSLRTAWGQKGLSGLGPTKELVKALVPTLLFVLGDLALYRAYEFGPATIVSPLSVIYPLVTLLYAVPVLMERISLTQWFAIMLLIAGIVAVSMSAPAAV